MAISAGAGQLMISSSLGFSVMICICCNVVGEFWELHLPLGIRIST